MNEQFEGLAKAIFDHDNSGPDCPIATWDQQIEILKVRFRAAAMTSRLINLGPIYRMELAQATEAALPITPESKADPRNPNIPGHEDAGYVSPPTT